MPYWMTMVVGVSLAVLFLLALARALRSRRFLRFFVEGLCIIAFTLLLRMLFGFPTPRVTVAKSASSDLALGIALFLFMVFGMLAQFLFDRLSVPQRERKRFDWGLFLAPLFASPVVFIPLLAAFQNADIDLTHLTTARFMVFLVAFQNGFFWREVFDKLRERLGPR
jgi:hypothetical protein